MILQLSPFNSPDAGEPERYGYHMSEGLRKLFRMPRSCLAHFYKTFSQRLCKTAFLVGPDKKGFVKVSQTASRDSK